MRPDHLVWEECFMPIYEFKCSSCGHQFEELILGRLDMSEVSCPKCSKKNVERLLSVFSGCAASDNKSAGAGCSSSSRFS